MRDRSRILAMVPLWGLLDSLIYYGVLGLTSISLGILAVILFFASSFLAGYFLAEVRLAIRALLGSRVIALSIIFVINLLRADFTTALSALIFSIISLFGFGIFGSLPGALLAEGRLPSPPRYKLSRHSIFLVVLLSLILIGSASMFLAEYTLKTDAVFNLQVSKTLGSTSQNWQAGVDKVTVDLSGLQSIPYRSGVLTINWESSSSMTFYVQVGTALARANNTYGPRTQYPSGAPYYGGYHTVPLADTPFQGRSVPSAWFENDLCLPSNCLAGHIFYTLDFYY